VADRPYLTPQKRQQHAQRIRQIAAKLPAEQRAEGMRQADNLVAAGRIRQQLADRNQHPAHPTKQ
jgi:hypothetical protein